MHSATDMLYMFTPFVRGHFVAFIEQRKPRVCSNFQSAFNCDAHSKTTGWQKTNSASNIQCVNPHGEGIAFRSTLYTANPFKWPVSKVLKAFHCREFVFQVLWSSHRPQPTFFYTMVHLIIRCINLKCCSGEALPDFSHPYSVAGFDSCHLCHSSWEARKLRFSDSVVKKQKTRLPISSFAKVIKFYFLFRILEKMWTQEDRGHQVVTLISTKIALYAT